MIIIIGRVGAIIIGNHHGCDVFVSCTGVEIQCAIDTERERCTDGQHEWHTVIGCFGGCFQITEFVIGQRSDGDGIDGTVVGDGEIIGCGIAAFIDAGFAGLDQSNQRCDICANVRTIIRIIDSFSDIFIVFKATTCRSGIGI